MHCPYCNHQETKVIDSRNVQSDIWRRRGCLKCDKRFTTYERIELLDLMIIKKDGRKERFDQQKLIQGMELACEKRNISKKRIEEIANKIEQLLRKRKRTEVNSKEVGDLVITRLKRLDDVAYLRFASVYKEFQTADNFREAAVQLKIK